MRIQKPRTPRTSRLLGAVGHQEQTVHIPRLADLALPPAIEPARRDLRPLGAVVFMPPGTPGRWIDACAEHIAARGYHLAAVCTAWRDAVGLLMSGIAQVVVVGRRDHVPPDVTPRLEVVAESRPEAAENRRRPARRR